MTQLWGAIEAVWRSWTLKKAVDYRRVNGISETLGTGVNIVSMVFGNLGDDSGTGVAFTRNPSTGEKKFYGEFLINAQGEDVVAGIRTPLEHRRDGEAASRGVRGAASRREERLEQHFRDMQDIEFTVERGQALSPADAHRQAHRRRRRAHRDRHGRRGTDRHATTAVLRVAPEQLDQLLHPVIDSGVRATPLCTGLPGESRARRAASRCSIPTSPSSAPRPGEHVILVRDETTPEDFHGIVAARAVLTARGGMTSHAAVVARGMGKCAVVGCKDIHVDVEHRRFTRRRHDDRRRRLDHASTARRAASIAAICRRRRARSCRSFAACATARTAPDVSVASRGCSAGPTTCAASRCARTPTRRTTRASRARFGAEGIGLCRTEHMFFEGDRITAMREMIVARDEGGRRRALAKLLPMQRADFEGIFEAMNGLPVTIRLLDPPLHEFLPHGGEETKLLARTLELRAGRAESHHRSLCAKRTHAGAPRVPARHHLSRDHRNAGPGDLRGRGAGETKRARRTS